MSPGSQQLGLLLWKDALLRKRKPITIGGVIWAAVALMSLVVVRKNVDNEVNPTCAFKARALPSAGVAPFLQSFLCTLSNDCDSLDQYKEIPDYEHTRLHKYVVEFLPVFENEMQRVLHAVPGAGRLLATITRTIDVPELHHIFKRGLKVADLFKNDEEVVKIFSKNLKISNNIVKTFVNSALNFENILQAVASENRVTCSVDSLSNLFNSTDKYHIKLFIQELCRLNNKDANILIIDLIKQVNLRKYINMLGKMMENLSGSKSIVNLSDMLDALLRLSSIENYVPQELQFHKWLPVIKNEIKEIQFKGFSYVNINIIYKLLDLFEPIFKNTIMFQNIHSSIDVLSGTLNTMRTLLKRQIAGDDGVDLSMGTIKHFFEADQAQANVNIKMKVQKLINNLESLTSTVKGIVKDGMNVDENSFVNGLSKVAQVIMNNMPKDVLRKVSYYITLMNKLVVGSLHSARVHLNMENIMFDTFKRNPKGVEIIGKLGPDVISRLMEGLSDADRIQAIRGKVFHPGQLFCDVYRLQTLLKMNKKDATDVKTKICNSQWKSFAMEVIRNFGVTNASKTINDMASFVVSETIHGDGDKHFIKVDVLFSNTKTLISYIKHEILNPTSVHNDWDSLFANVSNFKEIKEALKSKRASPNLMLVTVHTALAHEVISANTLLDTYMTPTIAKLSKALKALTAELNTIPKDLMAPVQRDWLLMYQVVLKVMKNKTKGLHLIIDRESLFCNMSAENNLSQSFSVEEINTFDVFCNISKAINNKLDSDPHNGILIQTVRLLMSNSTKDESSVDWVQMIKIMQQLYKNVDSNFGFLFGNNNTKSTENIVKLEKELDNSALFSSPSGYFQLSISSFCRLMDIFDGKIFELDSEPVWKNIKSKTFYLSKFMKELNIYTKTLAGFMRHDSNYTIEGIPIISTNLRELANNFAPLVRDVVSFIATKQVDIEPILDALRTSPHWPCGESGIGPALHLSPSALKTMRGAETLMCSGKEVMEEWNRANWFLWIDGLKSNDTVSVTYSEKIFYSTADHFNKFIDNFHSLGDAILNIQMDQYNVQGAFEDAMTIISAENNITIARRLFKNLDLIMNITNEGDIENSMQSPSRMWEAFSVCITESKNVSGLDCRPLAWKAVRFTAKYIAEAGRQMIRDLKEYFEETSDPNADFLQVMGFTKKTGLHILYEKLPDFIDILFKSFLDISFMKQITRAAGRKFWDCERIVDSLILPTSGYITEHHIKLIKPYVCPSLVHWISIPTNENVLFDIFAKSQNLYFNKPAIDFDAKFEDFFEQWLDLENFVKNTPKDLSRQQNGIGSEEWLSKFRNIGRTIIAHGPNGSITKKDILNSNYIIDGLNSLYLTKISYIVNNIYTNLKIFNDTFQTSQNKTEFKDYETFMKMLSRKPEDTTKIFVFAITQSLNELEDYETFNMVDVFISFCQVSEDLWTSENMWMKANLRVMKQFCKCDYKKYFALLVNETGEDIFVPNVMIKDFANTLSNISEIYNSAIATDKKTWRDILRLFLKLDTDKAGEDIRTSIAYSRELGLESMIVYQHTRINYLSLCLTLLNGDDWWIHLKALNKETILIDILENSSAIIDDLISNASKIKLIRLLKDININNTDLLCKANISDYVPDKTQLISKLKDYMCQINETALYVRITPLRLAAQIYDEDFRVKENINETILFDDIKTIEEKLFILMKSGPQKSQYPYWLTDEALNKYFSLENKVNQGPTKVEMAFLLINNLIDAATLFINSTNSPVSSTMTPWVKQVNLQLIKSVEYSAFVCDLPNLSMNEIHTDLIDTFHWDLALSEVISGRNYTWFELNKSLNQLSDISKHYAHDSMMGKMDRVMECLLNSTDDHPISKASMYLTLGSRVIHIIEAMLPHMKDIKGFANNSAIVVLKESLIPVIPVPVPLYRLIKNETLLKRLVKRYAIKEDFIDKLLKIDVNVNKGSYLPENNIDESTINTFLEKSNQTLNATNVEVLLKNIYMQYDIDYVAINIDTLRDKEFWSFKWVVAIASSVESVLWNSGQMLRAMGDLEWKGIKKGEPNALLDLFIYLMKEQFVDNIVFRLDSIIEKLHPLFEELDIERDMKAISTGLKTITIFRKEIVAALPLKFDISKLFHEWDELKTKIVNKTLLPQLLVEELQYGVFNLAPLINPEYDVSHVEDYICGPILSKLLQFNSTKITLTDVSNYLCRMTNTQIKNLVYELVQKLNFPYISDIVLKTVMKQVMNASDLTVERGNEIISIIGESSALFPKFQMIFTNISDVVKSEPLIQSLQKLDKVTDALANSNFLADAGNMMCGKPFYARVNKFYKSISELADNNKEPDQEQLDSLPTDFCRDMHKEILKMGGGKILWSYAKPLLMGKILYTPDTPQVRQIMTKANESFSQVAGLTSLISELSEAFDSLDEIIKHRSSLDIIYTVSKSPFVKEGLMKLNGNANMNNSIDLPDINLNELLSQFSDTDKMKGLVRKLSHMLDCISLNRFIPIENEEALEMKATKLMKINEFLAGVVFLNTNNSVNASKSLSIEYKIRMDIDNVPSTSRLKNQFWTPGPDGDFIDNLRYFRGFVQLQDLIDKAIIETRTYGRITKRDVSIVSKRNDTLNDWSVYTQQMPYPCWVKDYFQTTMYESQALIVAFFFCLILTVSSIVRFIVWERESGNTSLMCIMGMKRRWHTLSWLLSSFVEMIITMTVLCIILKWGHILPNTSTSLLYCMLINFGFSIIMFCYFISSTFRSASLGAVSAAILYLLTFMPYVIIIAMEAQLNQSQKLLASVFMSSGFSYGLLQTARYEVQGVGLQWHNLWDSPQADDSMSAALSCVMVLFDALFYAFMGWCINMLRFRDTANVGVIGNVDDNQQKNKVGVRIEKLSKVYSRGKTKALSDVSMDLYKGHITTLLGHNGAGKTTLINILTGITTPTSGDIIINKENCDKPQSNDEKIRNRIGLCPQFDVLLEVLTAREHLTYYAQLKTGQSAHQVQSEVDNMVDALGLGALAIEPVKRLSGGYRRRLCVGLAFIAHPHLVVLDEPSSGVDPVARRDIWALILSLKAERTILLTTHHLDEAEILSDSVFILHKGKIQASGSPLYLKQKYGDGYKMTITYPLSQQPFMTSETLAPKNCEKYDHYNIKCVDIIPKQSNIVEINEKVQKVWEVVNNVVDNAKVIDVKKYQVVINVPILNNKGVNNDLVLLTQTLEEKQTELNFSSMLADCGGLEEVFLSLCDQKTNEEANYNKDNQSNNRTLPQRFDVGDDVSENNYVSESSISLWVLQLVALLHKRFLHYIRNPRLLIAALFLPTLFVAVAMGFSLIRPPADSLQALNLKSSIYGDYSMDFASLNKNASIIAQQPELNEIMKKVIKTSSGNGSIQTWVENDKQCECIDGWQKCLGSDDAGSTLVEKQTMAFTNTQDVVHWIVNTHTKYLESRYGGWSAVPPSNSSQLLKNTSNFVVWYNNKGQHALPAYINTLNNAILKYKVGSDAVNITTYSHPLKLSPEQLSKATLLQHVADVGISVVLLIGFSLVPSVSAVFLVNERCSQQKRLQLLSAVHPVTYWLASLLWDIVIIIVAIILSVIVFKIFALPVYVSRQNLSAICFLLLLYGFSSSTLVHMLEKLFGEPSLANMVIFCCNVFVSAVGLTILLIIDVVTTSDFAQHVRNVLHDIFLLWPGFSLGDGLVMISRNSIQADILQRFGLETYIPPLDWQVIGPHCLVLSCTTILFFIINIAIEMRLHNRILQAFYKKTTPRKDYEEEDRDVATERYRIELATLKAHYNMGSTNDNGKSVECQEQKEMGYGVWEVKQKWKKEEDVLQLLGLCKEYNGMTGVRVAVQNLTFGVKKGQCFGLLGVNGAGKSTTFGMLTGEIRPTRGHIYVNGKRVSQRELCKGNISYCPQNDAIDPLLTLREHLHFYCRIRGLNKSNQRIANVMEELEITRYKEQRAASLSGGNKRKLCLAIALIGDSSLLLLDEPTSGMDPNARLHAGIALMRAAHRGRALLLSSHSLLECENLCSPTGLMWNGKLLALGAPTYLKQRFAGGHLVRLVGNGKDLWSIATTIWKDTRLLSLHPTSIQILLSARPLSSVFRGIASISTQTLLKDYSVNQSSLDQVFINFSNAQDDSVALNKELSGIHVATLDRHYNRGVPRETNTPTLQTKVDDDDTDTSYTTRF